MSRKNLLPLQEPMSEPNPGPSLWNLSSPKSLLSPKAQDDLATVRRPPLSVPLPAPLCKRGTDASLDLFFERDGETAQMDEGVSPQSHHPPTPSSAAGGDEAEPATRREMISNFFKKVKLEALRRVVLFGDQEAQEEACNEFKDLEGWIDGDGNDGEGGEGGEKKEKKDRKERKSSRKDKRLKRGKSKGGLLGGEEPPGASSWRETFQLAMDLQMGLCVLWCAAMIIVWAFGLLILELSVISCCFFFLGVWLAGDGKERRRKRRRKRIYGSEKIDPALDPDYRPPEAHTERLPDPDNSEVVKSGTRRVSQSLAAAMPGDIARLGSSSSSREGLSRRTSAASQVAADWQEL